MDQHCLVFCKTYDNDNLKSDGIHIMVLSLNWIKFRFWVEFLIGQFILKLHFHSTGTFAVSIGSPLRR